MRIYWGYSSFKKTILYGENNTSDNVRIAGNFFEINMFNTLSIKPLSLSGFVGLK